MRPVRPDGSAILPSLRASSALGTHMKIFILISVVVAGVAVSGADARTASAQTPPTTCLVQSNGAPRLIVGNGTSSNQNTAQSMAQSDWSRQAMSFGGQYQSWNRAANRSTSCSSARRNFSYVYSCRASAQPCV